MLITMILTNGFDPDPRVYKEALSLVEEGYNVEILCWDREGKYLSKESETINGIAIKRFYCVGKYGSGIMQLKGYISFLVKVIIYLKRNNRRYIHCHDLDALLIGATYKFRCRKCSLVYDQHDLFDLYFFNRKNIINKLAGKLIIKLEKICIKAIDTHIVVTPNMKNKYVNQGKEIFVINNAPMASSFKDIRKYNRSKMVIGFIGVIRYEEELKLLIDKTCNKKDIQVFIAGKGPKIDNIEEYVKTNNYKHVEIYGEYNIKDLEELYKRIDITFLLYPEKDAEISLPNKFFESIITETPIIASSRAEFGQVVEKQELGWSIKEDNIRDSLEKVIDDIEKKKEKIQYFKDNMTKYKNMYTWENNQRLLGNLYKRLFNEK